MKKSDELLIQSLQMCAMLLIFTKILILPLLEKNLRAGIRNIAWHSDKPINNTAEAETRRKMVI